MTKTLVTVLLALLTLSACAPMAGSDQAPAVPATDPVPTESAPSKPISGVPGLPAGVPESYPLADVEMKLERTVCFGFCPVYTVTVFGDGRVEYQGEDYVAVKGSQERQIESDAVVELLRAFYEADFFLLRDAYREALSVEVSDDGVVSHSYGMVTDMPTYIVTLRIGDYEKRVEDYWKAPESLRELEEKIDAAAGTGVWVGEPGPDGGEATPTLEPRMPMSNHTGPTYLHLTATALWRMMSATPPAPADG